MDEETGCPICEHLLNFCSEKGDKNFCEVLLERMKNNEITEKEFVEEFKKKFNVDIV